jgi:hypothetical protein
MEEIDQISTVWDSSASDRKTTIAILRKVFQIQEKEVSYTLRQTCFLRTSNG